MKNFRANRTLSLKLMSAVLLGSSIITFFITSFQLYWDYRLDLKRIDTTLHQVESLYLPGVTQSLWDLNDEHIRINLEGITQLNDVVYAAISHNEETVYRAGQQPVGDQRYIEFDINYFRDGNTYQLGRLEVIASMEGIYQRLKDKILVVFASAFVKTLILTGFMLTLFYNMVARHLIRIASHVTQFEPEKTDTPLHLHRSTQIPDELDFVCEALNSMTDKVREHLQQRNEAEQQLRALNSSLEAEVEKRTQKIKHQQMMIQNSARLSSLGEMAGSIAHEINNPLTIISGYMSMLRKAMHRGELTRQRFDHISERVESTIHRISAIIKGLLHLSRGDGNYEKTAALHNLVPILNDAIAISQEKFRSRGIHFESKLSSRNILAYCYPIEIGQIIVNLLNNAFDAVKDQKIAWIKIELSQESPDQAVFRIFDSGPGIPEDLHSKILEPFFTTKPPGDGTGLGLSISRAIAEKHRGRLFLDTRQKHTCFTLELPASEPKELSPPPPKRPNLENQFMLS